MGVFVVCVKQGSQRGENQLVLNWNVHRRRQSIDRGGGNDYYSNGIGDIHAINFGVQFQREREGKSENKQELNEEQCST